VQKNIIGSTESILDADLVLGEHAMANAPRISADSNNEACSNQMLEFEASGSQ